MSKDCTEASTRRECKVKAIQTWILPTTQRLSHPNVKIPVKTVKKIELFALNKLHRMSRSLVWLRSLVELLETEGRRRSWNEGDYSGFVMICWSNVDWLLQKENARNTPSQGVARFRHFRDFITVRGRLWRLWRLWQWFRHDFAFMACLWWQVMLTPAVAVFRTISAEFATLER